MNPEREWANELSRRGEALYEAASRALECLEPENQPPQWAVEDVVKMLAAALEGWEGRQ